MRVFANVTINVTADDIADLEKNGSVTNYGYVLRYVRPRQEGHWVADAKPEEPSVPKKKKSE